MKMAALFATPLLLLALAAQAQPATPRDEAPKPPAWITASNKPCKIWNPEPQLDESVTWSGECKDGYATGRGVLEWTLNGKPDARFEGVYLNGKRNGPGTITTPDGQSFRGVWINDEAIRPAGNSI